jgi:hypothetical protein
VRKTKRADRGRRSRVVLTPRRWRSSWRRRVPRLAGDGGKKARSPGRARRKPLKPLRGEGRSDPTSPVVTTLVCFLFYTRGRGCSGHPVFPAPSHLEERDVDGSLGRVALRDRCCASIGRRHCYDDFGSKRRARFLSSPGGGGSIAKRAGWGDSLSAPYSAKVEGSPHPVAHFAPLIHADPRASFARLGPLQGRVKSRLVCVAVDCFGCLDSHAHPKIASASTAWATKPTTKASVRKTGRPSV